MPRTKEHPLAAALRVAMDNVRPVRGKDEVALRSADWHAVERQIRKVLVEVPALDAEDPAPDTRSAAERYPFVPTHMLDDEYPN